MAQCSINLGLYEDALQTCNLALKIDPDHVKSQFRKATSLAYLFEFEKSRDIFKQLDNENSQNGVKQKLVEIVN